jgi:hypothetical protein
VAVLVDEDEGAAFPDGFFLKRRPRSAFPSGNLGFVALGGTLFRASGRKAYPTQRVS